MEDTVCRNCGATIQGRFCGSCGQKVTPLHPTLRELFHELTHEVLNLDGKSFRSVRHLLFSPGLLTRDHFEGRRARWVSPVRLYLTFSVIFFGLSALAPEGPTVEVRLTNASAEEIRALGFASEDELQRAITSAQTKWAPRLMFVLMPLFAWLVHGAFRRSGHNYPQHLYFAFHAHAAWFAAGAVGAAAQWIPWPLVSRGVRTAVLIYGAWYLVAAFRRVYGAPLRPALWKAAVVGSLYGLALILFTTAVVLPVIYGRRSG